LGWKREYPVVGPLSSGLEFREIVSGWRVATGLEGAYGGGQEFHVVKNFCYVDGEREGVEDVQKTDSRGEEWRFEESGI
jgi:hypothetical protein